MLAQCEPPPNRSEQTTRIAQESSTKGTSWIPTVFCNPKSLGRETVIPPIFLPKPARPFSENGLSNHQLL